MPNGKLTIVGGVGHMVHYHAHGQIENALARLLLTPDRPAEAGVGRPE